MLTRQQRICAATDRFFIVLDEAPIKRSPTPKYDLMFGNPDTACGFLEASHRTINALVHQVPAGEDVYRVFLNRTDGREGKSLIKRTVV